MVPTQLIVACSTKNALVGPGSKAKVWLHDTKQVRGKVTEGTRKIING